MASQTLTVVEESLGMVKVDDGHYEFWIPKTEFQIRTAPPGIPHHPNKMNAKMVAVLQLMSDGQWRTLKQISEAASYSSLTGLSACIRSLRKSEYGSHNVEKRFVTDSLYEYRLIR